MKHEGYIKERTKEDILAELAGTAKVGSPIHEQQKMGIIVRCTQDLETRVGDLTTAIARASDQSEKLNRRLHWLTVALIVATTIGAIATAFIAWQTLKPS